MATFIQLALTLFSAVVPALVLANQTRIMGFQERSGPPTSADYVEYYGVVALTLGVYLLLMRGYVAWTLAVYRGGRMARGWLIAFCLGTAVSFVVTALTDPYPDDHPIGVLLSTPFH